MASSDSKSESTPLDKAKQFLRSLLLSTPNGLSARNVEEDWQAMGYVACPYRELGFSSVENFLRSVPDVAELKSRRGSENIYGGVADKSTKHIKELVVNQKNSKARRRPRAQGTSRFAPPMPSRGRGRISATVQGNVQALLRGADDCGFHIDNACMHYKTRYGTLLLVNDSGYDSTEDFLVSTSNTTIQTRYFCTIYW